jgi:hypothetical protein
VRVRLKAYQIFQIFNKVKNNRRLRNLNLLKELKIKKRMNEIYVLVYNFIIKIMR